MTLAVELRNVSMMFNRNTVLSGVDFALRVGEVKGLVGKNGAGKSTLMKIIQGIHSPTSGTIEILGKDMSSKEDRSQSNDISMIFQEFSLIPEMTVTHNIFLNHEPYRYGLVDDRHCEAMVRDFFLRYGIQIDPRTKVKSLNTSDMQMVEICKAVLRNSRIILMDEPTAALDEAQTEKLFEIIGKLRLEGISIILITHHLKEIMKICDSVDVVRDGRIVFSESVSSTNLDTVISAMIGDEVITPVAKNVMASNADHAPLLRLREVWSRRRPQPISLDLYPGESLGLAGLMGSGRTELFNILFGIDPALGGEIELRGRPVTISSPADAVELGLFLVPENRQTLGLSMDHSLYLNMQLPWVHRMQRFGIVKEARIRGIVRSFIDRLHIKTSGAMTLMKNLSGGNQQKVVLAKAISSNPEIILLDDPTYGVDIHAKTEILRIIEEYRNNGNAVIIVSSDIDELINCSTRVLVMKKQAIAREINKLSEINSEVIMSAIQ